MEQKNTLCTAAFLTAGALAASVTGCELIATVDRTAVDSSGGTGGQSGTSGTASSSTASTSTGTGGSTSSSSTSSSSSGTGGARCSGGAMACSSPTDCLDPQNECVVRTCAAGCCGTSNVAAGVPTVGGQTAGDCKKQVCNGNGAAMIVPDDTDMPDDDQACTADHCSGGVPMHMPLTGPCTLAGNAAVCGDPAGPAQGTCVACNVDADCADPTRPLCQANACAPPVCANGTQDASNGETDVDCGGAHCGACANTRKCLADGDCTSGFCQNGTTCAPAPSCDPAVNVGPVADTCGTFVAVMGTPGSGTRASPFAALQPAIDAAVAASVKRVYACVGAFDGAVHVPSGVTLYGGLDCQGGSWAPGGKTTITAAAGLIPVRLEAGALTTSLLDVAVIAASAVAPGGSSIAVLAESGTATLTRCDLTTGAGADGSSGADGGVQAVPSSPGSSGVTACGNQGSPPASPIGGTGGTNVCGSSTLFGGPGGFGGLAPNGNGQAGQPGDFGGGGASGQAGAAGTSGVPGGGGLAMGLLSSNGYQGTSGSDGGNGVSGASGGGGAGGKAGLSCNGASGGGGGAGGCAGKAGSGGKAGGSSIAILSLGAGLTLSSVTFTLGNAGQGGRGGNGQLGQPGGAGGAGGLAGSGLSAGVSGGAGGGGGDGGSGGGGAGGQVLGIAYLMGSVPTGTPVILAAGTPGLAGLGGGSGVTAGGAGAPGQGLSALGF